jgi:hypothetical protein
MARLFAVPRLFVVSKKVEDVPCLTQATRELPLEALTLTTRKRPRPRYLAVENQPPLPAA